MRAAVSKNIYTRYKVGKNEVSISYLQYADDILLIGENSEHNIMVLKSILKCFELASGLKINFHKSCFMGLNLSPDFVTKAVDKLYCAVGSVPFKFLGIPVGANPKRLSTWSHIIDSFKKKLSLWKHKLISFGDATVESLGAWSNGVWSWSIHWRMNLFVWEEEEYEGLLRFLHNSMPKQHTADSWTWIHDISGQYSVRSAYQSLHYVEGSQDIVFFKRLWASNVPSKMKCLVWRIALDGVPTKVNFGHRGGLSMQDPLICSLCGYPKVIDVVRESRMKLLLDGKEKKSKKIKDDFEAQLRGDANEEDLDDYINEQVRQAKQDDAGDEIKDSSEQQSGDGKQ
ncbi:PREDICTED: uncharacterized protein LOC109340629 [Lupinus angustifolius]|uniref:uncharacterized protein LOC109340629 n=1 Tax=Lupinus angustifolius TaxID=3871 RepID=UPI00092F574A|nr:PREDICTED: uncharacterized protein LOC109340629 [Lupinus angustifolius]